MKTAELENDDTLEAIEINTDVNDADDDETNAISEAEDNDEDDSEDVFSVVERRSRKNA